MEIKIGIAKTTKYAVSHSGDSCEIAERPHGGVSAVLADGQGSGLSAHHTSSWVVNKAVSLLSDGTRDGAVARAVHDYLYAMKDKKVSCTLTVLSADLESESIVISRNSNCPVIIKTEDFLSVYDEEVNPIGVHRHTKPLMYEVPFSPGMVIVSYTDGIQAAGRKQGLPQAEFADIRKIIEQNSAEDAEFIAQSILEYALDKDQEKPGDDMTVVVMGVCEKDERNTKIRRLSATYPI